MKWPLLLLLLLSGGVARADIVHKLSTSTQLSVDSAASQATRLGSTYSVSGNNVKVVDSAQFGGLTKPSSVTAAARQIQAAYEMHTSGAIFSLTESFTYGDATDSDGTTVTAGVVPSLPAFGAVTTSAGGVAGSLAGTITSQGVMTLTAGGAGTSATGQFVSELTIK